jgi:UDP-GlcNAc:undecaprenyl-phosphate GlcNAc-1-phosphate transferase
LLARREGGIVIVGWWMPLVSVAACMLTLFLLLRHADALPLDHPNARSLHAQPTPRIGGVGLLAGLLVGLGAGLFAGFVVPMPLLLSLGLAGVLALFSLADDWRGLPVSLRFGAHGGAAALWLVASFADQEAGLPSSLWFLVVLWFALVWATNLFNFMDGADGLAGGMTVLGFSTYAVAAWLGGDPNFASLAMCIAAAALGFLHFNFPPARLFMGDVGSIPAGFLAAVLGFHGWHAGLWPWAFPLLVFSPFIVDATATLLVRAAHREKIWCAHRDHYYQRLVRMGWSHRRLALAAYVLMIGSAGSALLLPGQPELTWPLLAMWAVLYALGMRRVDHRWIANEISV